METISHYFSREQELAKGTRLVCYRNGEEVSKIISGFLLKSEATRIVQNISEDYETILHQLGDYVVPTLFGILENEKGFSVVLRQSYISGVSIKRAFELSSESRLDKNRLLDFLGRAVSMYQNTGQIPDVFGRPHIFGWYDVLTTPNVRIETTNNALMPKLLDVGFTRISQNLLAGGLHNRLLANNIRKVIEENA